MSLKTISSLLFIVLFFFFSLVSEVQSATVNGAIPATDTTVTTTKPLPLIQEKREMIIKNRQETKTMIKDKREEFKEKLQILRDERKKVMVERIDEKISTMNTRHTARFSTVLEKLEMVLNRVTEKARVVKLRGIDTSMVDSAILAAKSAIDTAKAAVTVQAAKTYIIEVASETTLRTTVGSIVSMFRKDIRDVHKTVVDAKQAVQKAERELAKLRGDKMEKAGENESTGVIDRIQRIPTVIPNIAQ